MFDRLCACGLALVVGAVSLRGAEDSMSVKEHTTLANPPAQCAGPEGGTTLQALPGQSVRNGVSPPLRSVSPAPPHAPIDLYAVPNQPETSCEPSSSAVGTATEVAVADLVPSSGPTGTAVTIRGAGFTPDDNAVLFGAGYIPNLKSPNGAMLTFTVPGSLDPACLFARPVPCRLPSYATEPGTYEVVVSNSNGTSNRTTFTVTAD